MMAREHMLTGVAAGLATAPVVGGLHPPNIPVWVLAVTAASYLPDIDHRNSTVTRLLVATRLASWVLRRGATHRGFTHSALFAAALGAATGWGTGWWWLGVAITVGCLTHDAGDMLTPGGVPILWPVKWRVKLGLFTTGGIMERAIVPAGLVALIVWVGQVDGYWEVWRR